jgi:hypothetical protein
MWRSKSFERQQVSPSIGFFGVVFRITFVSVVNTNSPNYLPSPIRRPKRKAVHLEDSQRNNLNTKRRKLDNVSYNYTL